MEGTWLFLTPYWTEKPNASSWRNYLQSASGVFGIFKYIPKAISSMKTQIKLQKSTAEAWWTDIMISSCAEGGEDDRS